MYITCLDMEGVLVPEIWIEFARESGIPELTRTTRDEPDYDKLMKWRLGVLREHGLGLKEIQETIARIDPLPGAKEFLDKLRSETQAIILSDTFEEFAQPLMKKLGWPTIFCNSLEVDADGFITGGKRNDTSNIGYDFNTVLGSNISENVDFTLSWNGTYNEATNSLGESGSKNRYFNHRAQGNMKFVFPLGFTFTASAAYSQYIGFTNDYDCLLYTSDAADEL